MTNENTPENDPKKQQESAPQDPIEPGDRLKPANSQSNPPEPNKTKDASPPESNTPTIPRGPVGDLVRFKIAVNNVRAGLSGTKKRIDTFFGLTTNNSDSENQAK